MAHASVDAEDLALLAELRGGNERAYARLVELHGPALLATARRLLGSEAEAEDAVQETFLSAFRNLARFEGKARLSTWLHRIAVNASLMRLRSRRRRPESSIEELLPRFEEDGHPSEPPQRWRELVGAELEREETAGIVRAAIDRLPEGYRVALVLRDLEGLDTAETARALDISENAVKIRLHRGRQALRNLLDPHFRSDVL